MDEVDKANAEKEAWLEINVKIIRQKANAGTSRTTCATCGKTIPTKRRTAMAQLGMSCERCKTCQEHFEKGVL